MRKGFTLTLSMVIILVFMTTILTIETQKVSIDEQTQSQHAKLMAINSILLDLNSTAFSYSLSRLGKRATFNVINEQIDSRLNDGPGYGYVDDAEEAICNEFENNFAEYLEFSLGKRLNDTGLSIKYNDMECNVELIDAFTVNLITSVNLIFKEENKIEIKKSISLNSNFSIEGLPDPLLAIESWDDGDNELSMPVIRPILLSSLYNNTDNWDDDDNLEIDYDDLDYAKGWISGELIKYDFNKINDIEYQKEVRGKILMIDSNVDDNSKMQDLIDFYNLNGLKGIAIDKSLEPDTNTITNGNIGAGCTANYTITTLDESQPCIMCGTLTNIKINKATCSVSCSTFGTSYGSCKQSGTTFNFYLPSVDDRTDMSSYGVGNDFKEGKFVLISENKDESFPILNNGKLYDIDRQKQATLCGNYFLSDDAPDFFSRMEGELDNEDEFGIETFILGTWVLNPDYSKLAHEYYSKESGVSVKGMSGCKDENMCDSFTEISNFGRFAIKENKLEKYGMEDIEYE